VKCPDCRRSHKAGQARLLTCRCGYRFVFDPRQHDGLTDGKFLALLRQTSRNDTVYFTLNQLYTQFCRRMRKGYRLLLLCGVLAGVGALVSALAGGDLAGLALFLGLIACVCLATGISRRRRPPPQRTVLERLVHTWQAAGRPIAKLLTAPGLHAPPPAWREPDLYDYGVERLLLVEHDLLVDLFVRNGLHAQERALILSETGYPSYLVPIAARCLQEQPQLPVYLLHDATPHGIAMAERLRASSLLPLADHAVHDLGIFPDDVRQIRRLRILKPRRSGYALPVDMLPVAMLTAGVTQAMATNLLFSDMLRRRDETYPSSGAVADFG
jgi:hypothetical protein